MIASVLRPAAASVVFGGRVLGADTGTRAASGGSGGSGASAASLPGNRDTLPDGLAAQLAAALRRVSGLEIDLVGARSVERAVGERIRALIDQRAIVDPWSYPARIEDDAEERQWLIEAAVVPETWFFRHRESFDFLALQARQRYYEGAGTAGARLATPLRIASVPCSTGEEPYSIAMTLLQDGLPPNAFLIDAMDISAVALGQAQAGVYRPNAFRGCPDVLRDRFFTARSQSVAGSAIHETVWDINRDARACVSFRRVNLVADARIGADTGQGGTYDFIFCRNVLIYFDRPTQAAVIEKLRQALRPGGFLLVGPAEAALVSRAGLTAAAAPLAFAFHRDRPVDAPGTHRIGGAPLGNVAGMPLRPVPPVSPPVAPKGGAGALPVSGIPGVPLSVKPNWRSPAGASGDHASASPQRGVGVASSPGTRMSPLASHSGLTGAASPASLGRGALAAGAAGGSIGRPAMPIAPLQHAAKAQSAGGKMVAGTPNGNPIAAAYAEAERLANLGDIAQATQRCQAMVAAGTANADVYCLMGVLADAGGRSAEAREHFRRALYLEANHAGALLQFAEHLAMEGDDAGAQRLMARARRAHPDLF
jgi:chemotaxis protein methyltransferase WspC